MELSEFGLHATVEVVTPEMAHSYLLHNARHRPIKEKKVNEYMAQMIDGSWKLNGKPIIFDSNGRLLNGQHRLSAVIKAGVPLTTVVIHGVDPAVQETNEE